MATACSIIRDPNDPSIINFVEAPNGSRSGLYDDLRERTDQNQALSLWLTTKTRKFIDQVANPALNKHRIKLMSRVGDLGPKVSTVQVAGQTINLDNMDFTNLQVNDVTPGPKSRSIFSLKAFGFPEAGGEGVQVGRIRYRVSGNEMIVESSTLTNVGSKTVELSPALEEKIGKAEGQVAEAFDKKIADLKERLKNTVEAEYQKDKAGAEAYTERFFEREAKLRAEILQLEEGKEGRKVIPYDDIRAFGDELNKLNEPFLREVGNKFYPRKGTFTKGKKIGENEDMGGIYEVEGDGYLYRGVSEEDYARMQQSGFIDTDSRGVITEEEEVNLATDANTAINYLPPNGKGLVLAIKVSDKNNLFMIGADDYVRAKNGRIPFSDIKKVTSVIGTNEKGKYTELTGEALTIKDPVTTTPTENIKGLGIGSAMYGELFKQAIKKGMTVVSSDNLSPASRALWQKLVNQGIAIQDGNRFRLNMYPGGFDNNGEPSMASVIDFTDRQGVGPNVTLEEQLEIMDTMVGLPIEDSQALLVALKRGFMPDGYFKPTRSSLMMTGLYSSTNITEIMLDENLQQRIRDFIYKLEKVDVVLYNDMYVDEAYNVVEDGTKTAIGTYKLRNPFIVEQEVIEQLGGIQNRDRFEEELYTDDVQEIVGDAYAAFKGTQTDLFYTMKKYRTADEVLIDEDGLAPRVTGAFEGMYETIGKPATKQLETDADLLQSLDEVMWIENPKMADDLLGSVQKELQKIGMDIENLPQIARINGIEDTKDFLRAARDFAQRDTRDSFNDLVEAYETLYDIKPYYMQKKVQLPNTVKSGNIVSTQTDMTGPEVFTSASLIPVGNGVYKRVQPVSVDQMLESMYEFRLKSNGYEGVLPDKALAPAAFDSDGIINMAKVQDPNNKAAILNSMKAWVESEVGKLYTEGLNTDMETLQSYVLMFHYYNRSGEYSKFDSKPTMAEDYQSMVTPITNLEYLLTDFVEEFNLRMLSEKRKNSDIYKNFYSNFKVTANGIELISNDPITKRRMEPYLEDNENLINYFRAHKNKPELKMDIAPEEQIIDDLYRRNYYTNYPTALAPFTGEYTPIKGGTVAVKVKHPFVRLSSGVYELIMGVGRFGIYQKLPVNRGPVKRYDPSFRPPALDASPANLENISGTVKSTMEIKNLYDQNEKDDIDDKYDNCR